MPKRARSSGSSPKPAPPMPPRRALWTALCLFLRERPGNLTILDRICFKEKHEHDYLKGARQICPSAAAPGLGCGRWAESACHRSDLNRERCGEGCGYIARGRARILESDQGFQECR